MAVSPTIQGVHRAPLPREEIERLADFTTSGALSLRSLGSVHARIENTAASLTGKLGRVRMVAKIQSNRPKLLRRTFYL